MMQKEEILQASRKENRSRDLPELAVVQQAGAYATAVGGAACCVVLVLASVLADTMLYSPWFIYFSMLGTNWLLRSLMQKKRSDWVLTGLFLLLALLALLGFVLRLVEVGP